MLCTKTDSETDEKEVHGQWFLLAYIVHIKHKEGALKTVALLATRLRDNCDRYFSFEIETGTLLVGCSDTSHLC